MKNIAIVNLIDYSDYFLKDVGGKKQLDIVKKYAESLPGVTKVCFLLSNDLEGADDKILKESWTEDDLIKTLLDRSKGFQHLFYFFGDCPLLDIELSKSMFDDHINYYAEYTFADGYPYGLTPEILDVEILQPLTLLSRNSESEVKRDSIFNVIKKDINSFELETKIAKKDLRLLRVSLTSDNKRNYNQLNRIIEHGGVNSDSVARVLEEKPQILLTEPSYVNLDITRKKLQQTPYLPSRAEDREFMDLKDLDVVLDKVKEYCDDATFAFVTEYEPTTHPNLFGIIKKITAVKGFNLYIETSGLGWSQDLKDEVVKNRDVCLIITLDALNPELYREIRGTGQDEAVSFSKEMISLIRDRVYIQATRMKTNEGDMEPFYRFWQEYTDNIIIQKYSDYNKRLKDLKVADLSPLKRFPCWHIKRDLFIGITGEVHLCYNDLDKKYPLGSLITGEMKDIMNKKQEYYLEHINCKYSDLCRKCDEYYTFNF